MTRILYTILAAAMLQGGLAAPAPQGDAIPTLPFTPPVLPTGSFPIPTWSFPPLPTGGFPTGKGKGPKPTGSAIPPVARRHEPVQARQGKGKGTGLPTGIPTGIPTGLPIPTGGFGLPPQ